LLFSKGPRSFYGPRSEQESAYEYLNRSARPEAEWLRNLLEIWFTRFPEESREELAKRFRSRDDREHLSAFFELYCYTLLVAQGFKVECHQGVSNVASRPDFRVSKEGTHPFFMECTLSTDPGSTRGEQARLNQLLEYLNKNLKSPEFFVMLTIFEIGPNSAPAAKISSFLEQFLKTLDPDTVARDFQKRGPDAFPKVQWCRKGWRLEFCFVPKQPKARGKEGLRPIGGVMMPTRGCDSRRALLNALRDKATKYGHLPGPYIIAVAASDPTLNDVDVEETLFGSVHVSMDKATGAAKIRRIPNGFWHGPKGIQNQRVSGVLIFTNLDPWSVRETTGVLWHNPWASNPLDPSIWAGPQRVFSIETQSTQLIQGVSFPAILGIGESSDFTA